MDRSDRLGLRLVTLAALALACLSLGVGEPGASRRAGSMREKLEHSKQILDGLVREDFPRIRSGALALRAMRDDPGWTRLSRPEAGRYALYDHEFQALAAELASAADSRNLDVATRTYGRLSKNCVSCHGELRRGR